MSAIAERGCCSLGVWAPWNEGKARLAKLFTPLSAGESAARTLCNRVVWLKDVVVALFLCIPVIGHVLWYFPYLGLKGAVRESSLVPEMGLPREGLTCWVNSTCQLVLRSSTIVERILALAKMPNPPETVVLFDK